MAKRLPFIISSFLRHFSIGIEHQQQQEITKVAGEVCELIRTCSNWESSLISTYPSFNFSDPRFFNQVLKLQNNLFFSLRFFNWLTSHSRFSPDPTSLHSLFTALIQSRSFAVAKSFLDSLAQLKLDPEIFESLLCGLFNYLPINEFVDFSAKFKSLGFCPSIETWNAALSRAVRVKRTDVVWGLYGEMLDLGVVVNAETPGYLIQACCIDKNYERGYELLSHILGGGRVVPDNFTMARLFRGLSECGRFDRVSELLHLMIETNHNPDIYTYHSIIYGLCKNGRVSEGYRIFKSLKERGYDINREVYTTMIHGLCQKGWYQKAEDLWSEMNEKGILPDEYTYNVIIFESCRRYALEEALNLQKEMCDRGYKLNTVNYTTLISGLCKSRKIKEAYELFEEMSRNGVARNVVTYNSLIRGVCSEGDLASGQVLFEELLSEGLEPTTSSYTPFIEQLCCRGRTQEALELLWDMMNRGVEPSIYIRECIIDGWCREGSPIEGMTWLFEMLDMKLYPGWRVFETLIQCLLEQDKLDDALLVLNSMLPLGYMLKKVLCCSLISKLCSTNSNHVEMLLQELISSSEVS